MKGALIVLCGVLSLGLSTKVSAQSHLLSMVQVGFCNNNQTNKELDLIAKAGNELPICVEFTNSSIVPITLNVEFLDSVITDDSLKGRACNASDRPKRQFGNFMLPYSGTTYLPGKQTIQKEYIIQHPIGFSGLSHGCLAYNIVGADINNGEIFTVRIRSIKYIDIFVSNSKAVQMITLSQSPILTKIDNEYIITLGLINKGNVPEKLHITSVLSNIFGFQKDFAFDVNIPANTGILLTTPSFIMPIYGGPYLFKNKISYTPDFNFNITNGTHPSDIYIGGIKRTQTLLFVWTRQSWLTIIILALFFYVLYGAIRERPNFNEKKSIKKNPK
ncbi:MAG: hypothetical protein WC010_00975 [Candidatus Absconditabacterales bacterium]